jgi:hypothetical protein
MVEYQKNNINMIVDSIKTNSNENFLYFKIFYIFLFLQNYLDKIWYVWKYIEPYQKK